ncbi:virginiamycin A acetyltransferase [Muribaculaceae bacterium]|nr:virginiamycin A acetyltransferase [Muribaculaceae bacterium]
MKIYPDKDKAFPNPAIPSLCYIKNVVKNPRIIIGDYTYYDDIDGADRFEEHVTHFYEFIGDRLIIGNFCAIAKGGYIRHERCQPSDGLRHDLSVLYNGGRVGWCNRSGNG